MKYLYINYTPQIEGFKFKDILSTPIENFFDTKPLHIFASGRIPWDKYLKYIEEFKADLHLAVYNEHTIPGTIFSRFNYIVKKEEKYTNSNILSVYISHIRSEKLKEKVKGLFR